MDGAAGAGPMGLRQRTSANLEVMDIFLREGRSYTFVLRSFAPPLFPGVLCSFARVFEQALV